MIRKSLFSAAILSVLFAGVVAAQQPAAKADTGKKAAKVAKAATTAPAMAKAEAKTDTGMKKMSKKSKKAWKKGKKAAADSVKKN